MPKIAIPQAPEELQEFLTDKTKLDSVMKEGQLPEFITAYAKAVNKADKDINAQVTEQVDRVMADFLREHGADLTKRPDLRGKAMRAAMSSSKGTTYSPKAPGAKIDDLYESPSEFLNSIHHLADRQGENGAKLSKIKNAMGSTVGSDGGYLVPEAMRAELLAEALETAVVRPRARVIPMETLRIGFPAIDSTSNASSVFGGITAYWTEESAALINTSPTFSRVVLEAKKLTAYTEVPNELGQDSALSLDALISQLFPEALAWYEDAAFLTGTGVGEPLGMLSSLNPAAIAVTAESGQATATILWENIVKMYSRMLPGVLGRAVWIAHIDTFPQLATMALSVGTGGSAVWLNNGQDGPPVSILGRPVIFTEKAQTTGTQGDLSFVDFGHYLVGDRQSMSAMSSPHYKFGNDVTAYRVIERVDGRPWLQSAITPKNGSNTLSAIVQLATR